MPDYRDLYRRGVDAGWAAGSRSMIAAGRTEWTLGDHAAAKAAQDEHQPRPRTAWCYLDGWRDATAGRPRDETGGKEYREGYAAGKQGDPL